MAINGPRKWKRQINTDIARFPLHIRSYPPAITSVSDPNHPDEDMRQHLTPIGQDPETFERQEGAWDVGNSMLFNRGELDRHMSETVWSARKGVILNTLGKASKTKAFECVRCGKHKKASQSMPVQTDAPPYTGLACRGGCKDWNTERRPWGARRRRY